MPEKPLKQTSRELHTDEPNILIIRPSALGDVSRTVPALVRLREAFPNARIDWLVAEAFADVVQHHPMLDGVVTFARDRLGKFGLSVAATREGLLLAKLLRANRYHRVYDLQGLMRSGLLTWLTRSPRRVGFANAREGAWLAYNTKYHIDTGMHTVDRMLGLLEADGIQADGSTADVDLRLYVGKNDNDWLDQFLADNGIDNAGDKEQVGGYCCIAPTARWRCKCWPIDRYAKITARLLNEQIAGRHVIVLSSPAEREQLQPLLEQLNAEVDRKRIEQVICPTTTVGRLMALISRCRLLVCNDSAALHIAVGLGRPAVAVYGPTDPDRVGPYRSPHLIIRPDAARNRQINYRNEKNDQRLIAQVSVEQVWDKIIELIR